MKAWEVTFGILPSLYANDEENNGMDLHGYMATSIAGNGCVCFGGFSLFSFGFVCESKRELVVC